MKYLSKRQIIESLDRISNLNQFFGLTYLAAKRAGIPINKTSDLSLDSLNATFLQEFYKLDPRSEYFFRAFRFNNKDKFWVNPDYAGKGLQKLNTTTFKDAFIHDKKRENMGLESKLY